jgi:hypothetical protein
MPAEGFLASLIFPQYFSQEKVGRFALLLMDRGAKKPLVLDKLLQAPCRGLWQFRLQQKMSIRQLGVKDASTGLHQ